MKIVFAFVFCLFSYVRRLSSSALFSIIFIVCFVPLLTVDFISSPFLVLVMPGVSMLHVVCVCAYCLSCWLLESYEVIYAHYAVIVPLFSGWLFYIYFPVDFFYFRLYCCSKRLISIRKLRVRFSGWWPRGGCVYLHNTFIYSQLKLFLIAWALCFFCNIMAIILLLETDKLRFLCFH